MLNLIREKKVELKTGAKRTMRNEQIKNGTHPTSIKIGDRAVAWIESEIIEWQRARAENRDTEKCLSPGGPIETDREGESAPLEAA